MNKILEDLKKLKTIYSEKDTFQIGDDLKVSLKILTSEDETNAQSYAMGFDQGLAYLYALKRDTICRAIIGLNGKELPEIIEVDNDNKEQRHLWLRNNIICGWPQTLIDNIWDKYATLIERLDAKLVKELDNDLVKK